MSKSRLGIDADEFPRVYETEEGIWCENKSPLFTHGIYYVDMEEARNYCSQRTACYRYNFSNGKRRNVQVFPKISWSAPQ